MLSSFTAVANQIAATTKRTEKERLLADYLAGLDDSSLDRSAVFFTGSLFPGRDERVTGAGWSIVAEAASEATGASKSTLSEQTRAEGDLGDGLASLFPEHVERDISIVELGEFFDELAATSGSLDKTTLLTAFFRKLDRQAARFVTKILLNEFRIGLQTGLVESAVAKAFGRRLVDVRRAQMEDTPVVFFAFDVLFTGDEVVFELPLQTRLSRLSELLASTPRIRPSTQSPVRDAGHIDELFDQARARGNEGLVIKGADSLYTPGRRGEAWLKYKKALATLDCVITAAQYGHGKRRRVLSDYTFAVRSDDQLLNIGKAYSGLTDAEIEQLTVRLGEITTSRHGPVHIVRPEIVLEIAFDRIQESARHKSGYALRFPRIANLRSAKSPEEISTLDEVRRIYEGQLKREAGAVSKEK